MKGIVIPVFALMLFFMRELCGQFLITISVLIHVKNANLTCILHFKRHALKVSLHDRLLQLQGYDVESVLGKEVGPLAVYVRVVTRKPALWMGLEEICLQAC